ncbi:MAG: AAA family ATPase [Nitrososphaerales archaeon]|nr:AAA family ATPase [Nitrososphaerales archaeon]
MEIKKDFITPRDKYRSSTIIEEVILENFMSYEYARIRLKPGLNIICGPNGSGKSSILLGIAVALGQAYTERSRRLSDLIRHGKDVARVSLIFDNRARDGKRPIPIGRSDTFMLSRYLKSDGSYWYEADYREVSKNDVRRLLERFGIHPDNLLIIMHQGMIEEFATMSPQEKLKMVEESVGFREYRERISDAEAKLSGLISEERSLIQILDTASQTLDYWKSVYDKYLLKKGLKERKEYLEREYVWAQALKYERTLESLKTKLTNHERILEDLKNQIERVGESVQKIRQNLSNLQTQLRKLYFSLLRLEKEKAVGETWIKVSSELQGRIVNLEESLQKILIQIPIESGKDLQNLIPHFTYIVSLMNDKMEEFRRKSSELNKEILEHQAELNDLDKKIESEIEKYVSNRVEEAILNFKKKTVEHEIAGIKRSISDVESSLAQLSTQLERAAPRIETERTVTEIAEEIKLVNAHLESLGDVPEDAVEIYESYSKNYEELKSKLQLVNENKQRVLKELEERRRVWRDAIRRLLDEVNPRYQAILSKINATGYVRLIGEDDVESAGLELLVGFRGAPMMVLDAYTQSGGERSVSIMAFLLSLQQLVLSPFRAVDEFDVHMDPKNREVMFQMILSHIKELGQIQYILITPSQLTFIDENVNIIIVQNEHGKSEVKEVITKR